MQKGCHVKRKVSKKLSKLFKKCFKNFSKIFKKFFKIKKKSHGETNITKIAALLIKYNKQAV